MSSWQIILPWLVPMAILTSLSALFSGSEAALFSLRERDLRELRRGGAAGKLAADLLNKPERLLSAILFWNLLVNMTFFGIAGIITGKIKDSAQGGAQSAIIFSAASLLFVIFFSEMLPKSIGVLVPRKISLVIGLPLTIAVRIISPMLPLISVVNLAVQRLAWPSFTPEPEIDLADIGRAIEFGTDDAALAQQEQAALHNLVHLADLRIDECMRPRSQLMLVRRPVTSELFTRELPAGGYALVIEGESDEIIGSIAVGSIRPSQFDDLESVIEPVCYVPWSASLSSVLDLLQRQRLSTAVIVNEFGASIGVLSVDDVMRHVLTGRFEHVNEAAQQPIEVVGAGHFRAHGAVGARKLAKQLEIAPPEGRTVSIAGLMQRINEHPPRLGDTCEWNEYVLEVVQEFDDGGCLIDIRHLETIKETPPAVDNLSSEPAGPPPESTA
ncbi:MAG: CNNM domain-containing protein [Planctomycetaceae bacterium]